MESFVSARSALLQALIRGPGYGLELIERVRTSTSGRVKLNQGSVYPALRALERGGFVESYEVDEALGERGGRPRRYYRITADGERAARDDSKAAVGLFQLAGVLL
jgi:PadR family transcriptional regulator PadR